MLPVFMPPHLPLCLLYSAAMILDATPQQLLNEIGHDGLETWWTTEEGIERPRGHNIEEIQDCCLRRGKALVAIEPYPVAQHADTCLRPIWDVTFAWKRFCALMTKQSGIIHTESHAMAQDRGVIYDPRGSFYHLNPNNPGHNGIIGGYILVSLM